jgi:hypothetical protein
MIFHFICSLSFFIYPFCYHFFSVLTCWLIVNFFSSNLQPIRSRREIGHGFQEGNKSVYWTGMQIMVHCSALIVATTWIYGSDAHPIWVVFVWWNTSLISISFSNVYHLKWDYYCNTNFRKPPICWLVAICFLTIFPL